jgi:hypothetical protein
MDLTFSEALVLYGMYVGIFAVWLPLTIWWVRRKMRARSKALAAKHDVQQW